MFSFIIRNSHWPIYMLGSILDNARRVFLNLITLLDSRELLKKLKE